MPELRLKINVKKYSMGFKVIQDEAFDQLQRDAFAYMKMLFEEEHKKDALEWLDSNKALALLNVSKRTLQAWRDSGLLGFSQIGNKIYYSREEINRFLLSHSHKPFKR
ncbi:helix-turn-helix domain-containing protein [Hymenobacter sp. HD11105]